MSGPIVNLGAVAGVIVSLGASAVGAQQQVKVSVAAVPNPITAGTCTRIWADVRDELNRQLTLENGVPLQWGSYDYTTSNGTDFEWRSTASGEFELCAKPGVGAVSTEVTATIKGMPYSGTTLVAVAAQSGAAPPNAGGVAPGDIASAAPPPAGPQPPPAAATVPAQPYVPAPAYAPPAQASSPPAQTYSPPAQTYAPPQTTATNSPPAGAAQPPAAAPAPPQQAQAQPVKSAGGFFKKLGSHIKQRAAEVKNETSQNLTAAATQVVDTTFKAGSRLVASTTAEVTNTARLGIGGVGQRLMLAPQRGGANADNLALAMASGRAVLLEMRFSPNTDVLEPAARDLVLRVAEELKKAIIASPTSSFVIEAHVESAPNGQVLSEYRAAAVKVALIRSGVDASRLMALGYGASRPLEPGGPPVARVEIARAQ